MDPELVMFFTAPVLFPVFFAEIVVDIEIYLPFAKRQKT